MANRELSSTLRNLKFMQRANLKKEETKIEASVEDFPSSCVLKKCVVIYEADPHPEAISGRMSFLSFNPLIDKINEGAFDCTEHKSNTGPDRENKEQSIRRNGNSNLTKDGSESCPSSANGKVDHKRKQMEVIPEDQDLIRMRKFDQNNMDSQRSSDRQSNNKDRQSNNKDKHKKIDWNVLRHPNSHNKKRFTHILRYVEEGGSVVQPMF